MKTAKKRPFRGKAAFFMDESRSLGRFGVDGHALAALADPFEADDPVDKGVDSVIAADVAIDSGPHSAPPLPIKDIAGEDMLPVADFRPEPPAGAVAPVPGAGDAFFGGEELKIDPYIHFASFLSSLTFFG
jgi:hypothetical protein